MENTSQWGATQTAVSYTHLVEKIGSPLSPRLESCRPIITEDVHCRYRPNEYRHYSFYISLQISANGDCHSTLFTQIRLLDFYLVSAYTQRIYADWNRSWGRFGLCTLVRDIVYRFVNASKEAHTCWYSISKRANVNSSSKRATMLLPIYDQ